MFIAYAEGIQQLFAVDADGSNVKRLTTVDTVATDPAWSPEGTRIAFVRYVIHRMKHRANVFQMNSDGGNLKRLTAGPVADQRPAFSPDGSKLAFQSNRDGNYEIYVKRLY